MKDDVSHLFKNVFLGMMILINLSLVLYISLSGLSITISTKDGKLFGFTDSFYGSFLGALFTGGVAIVIFAADVVARRITEARKLKRENKNNLVKLELINNEVIGTLSHFSDRLSGAYNNNKEFLFRAHAVDVGWLAKEIERIDSKVLTDQLLKDYLTYSRLLAGLYNEMNLFLSLPTQQKAHNINGLVDQVNKVKVDCKPVI